MFKVGDRVNHLNGHGLGRIVAMNENDWGIWHKGRYPYVVQFDVGYRDVYAESDLTQVIEEDEIDESLRT